MQHLVFYGRLLNTIFVSHVEQTTFENQNAVNIYGASNIFVDDLYEILSKRSCAILCTKLQRITGPEF
jgi:hypothetical protein